MTLTLEKYDVIDIREIFRKSPNLSKKLYAGKTLRLGIEFRYPWLDRFTINRNSASLEYRDGCRQTIEITWTHCHFGSVRPWFVCGYCRRRAAKLFRLVHCFCRECTELRYACQRKSTHNRRALKACKLRLRLNGLAALSEPIPDRPRGMHRRTYRVMRAQIEALQSTLPKRVKARRPNYELLVPK